MKSLLKKTYKRNVKHKIDEMITSIYNLSFLGIYTEMTEGLK